MREQTLTWHADDGHAVSVTVAAATVARGIRRTRLRLEAQSAGETDPDRALLRTYTYPDIVAGTTRVEGLPWPLFFEAFLELPDAWVGEWESAVYALNPHWLPGGGLGADPKA